MTLSSDVPSRVLEWEGCFNVRDLGGLATGDGRRIRRGALIRSDIPTRLTEKGRHALIEHGVRTIVDVRFHDELEEDGDRYPFRTVDDAAPAYRHVPFHAWDENGPDQARIDAYRAAPSRAALIRLDIDLNQAGIAAAAAAIAGAEPGGVMIHCHAGKDRTGIIVAVILSLLGVPDEEIADDYALTQASIEPLVEDWLNSMSSDPIERQRLFELAWPSREAMLDALEHLRRRYGSAERYLRDGGLSPDELEALRLRLVEAA